MVQQVLAPGVEHGEEADLGAQVPGIGRDRAQGLGRRAEQDAVDDLLVLVGDGGVSSGTVKTTWKYWVSRISARRSSSHSAQASDWHFGQCRFRQLL